MLAREHFDALPSLEAIRCAAREVHAVMAPTPQLRWPLLDAALGCEVWVKHENHTPVGAFKIRGGIVYFNRLREAGNVRGVIAATRGNHGQSIAFAGARGNVAVTIVVPYGNSREKNEAMRALGADLVEYGHDFAEAFGFASDQAAQRGLHFVPSYAPELVRGVATYALEFFEGVPLLDTVYAPLGLGSGLSGLIAVRNGLELATEVVAVVAAGAPAYALSLQARRLIEAPAETIADGIACRQPNADALALFLAQRIRCVTVTEAQIQDAMRRFFSCTHNVAEPAAAAALAAALNDRAPQRRRIGVVLSGANVDRDVFARVLAAA